MQLLQHYSQNNGFITLITLKSMSRSDRDWLCRETTWHIIAVQNTEVRFMMFYLYIYLYVRWLKYLYRSMGNAYCQMSVLLLLLDAYMFGHNFLEWDKWPWKIITKTLFHRSSFFDSWYWFLNFQHFIWYRALQVTCHKRVAVIVAST